MIRFTIRHGKYIATVLNLTIDWMLIRSEQILG